MRISNVLRIAGAWNAEQSDASYNQKEKQTCACTIVCVFFNDVPIHEDEVLALHREAYEVCRSMLKICEKRISGIDNKFST